MKKIKVLQFVPTLSKGSGVINVLMNYFKEFNKKIEFDFLYFNHSEENFSKDIKKLGGKFYKICSPLRMNSFFNEYKEFCSNHYGEFDVFENNIIFLEFFFRNTKKNLGVKCTITHSHATKFGDSKFSNFRNHLFYVLTGKKTGNILFSCTKDAGEKIFGKDCKKMQWYIVNNAFDLNEYKFNADTRKKVRKKMEWEGKYIIGHVGRFSPPKNHRLIVKCFADYHKRNDNARLILVGDGILKKQVSKECTDLNVRQYVEFLGQSNDVNELLQGFDMFIFPSVFEGLGLALVEAQVAGLPCLVSDVVPQEANFTGYKSLSLDDESEWVKQIGLLKNKERNLNGFDLAVKANFNIHEESKKLERIYLSLVGR